MQATKAFLLLVGIVFLARDSYSKKKGAQNIEVETMDIKGLIQKPQAYYILNKSDVAFESHEEEFPAIDRINKQLMDPIFRVE